MATTTPLEDVKTASKMMMVALEAVVIILKAPAAAVVHFVIVLSHTAFELQGAREEAAPILAIGFLMLTEMIAPSTSPKAWCLV